MWALSEAAPLGTGEPHSGGLTHRDGKMASLNSKCLPRNPWASSPRGGSVPSVGGSCWLVARLGLGVGTWFLLHVASSGTLGLPQSMEVEQ